MQPTMALDKVYNLIETQFPPMQNEDYIYLMKLLEGLSKKKAKHTKTNTAWFHSYMVPRIVKFMWQKIEWWLPEAGGEEEIGSYLMGMKFQFRMMKMFSRWMVVMVAKQCQGT